MSENQTEQLKIDLRRQARNRRADLSGADRDAAAQQAAVHFRQHVQPGENDVVALYWSIRDELDTRPLLLALMDAGLSVCLPVVHGDNDPLVFRIWQDGEPLYESGFGTLAPGDNAPEAVPDILVMPLLAFDASGTRLGYGGGYYDRTIARLGNRPQRIGYCFSAQELPEIPRAEHDAPLDMIVTETGIRRFDN